MDSSFEALILLPVLGGVLIIGLLVLALAVVFNGRGEVDETGRRSTAIYLAFVIFISLYTVILAGVAAVGSISSLIVDEDERSGVDLPIQPLTGQGDAPAIVTVGLDDDPELEALADGCTAGDFEACDQLYFQSPVGSEFESLGETCGGINEPVSGGCVQRYGGGDVDPGTDGFADDFTLDRGTDPDDEAIRDTVQAGLVAILAAVVLVFHVRRRRELVAEAGFAGTAAWRADRAFLHVVSAVAVLIALFAAASLLNDLFRLIAPGITSDGSQSVERKQALADIIPLTVLTVATTYLFGRYWSESSGQPPFWRTMRSDSAAAAPAESAE